MSVFGNLMVDQFFRTNVTSAIAVGATTITVADSSGFPTPVGDKFFYLTLVNENDVAEVVRIANVTGLTLTLVAGDAVQNGFAATTTRAELWFTAEAFEDMQEYILSLNPGIGGGYEPDEVALTLDGFNELTIKDFGITGEGVKSSHIGDEQVIARTIKNGEVTGIKLSSNAVAELNILDGAVTTNKIFSGAVTLGKIEPIATGKVMGNLTGLSTPPVLLDVDETFSGEMGGGLPGTEQTLVNQRAVYEFVKEETDATRLGHTRVVGRQVFTHSGQQTYTLPGINIAADMLRTQGSQIMSGVYTPKKAGSLIRVEAYIVQSFGTGGYFWRCGIYNSTTTAPMSQIGGRSRDDFSESWELHGEYTTVDTSPITFSFRAGVNSAQGTAGYARNRVQQSVSAYNPPSGMTSRIVVTEFENP
jgi:hypothetical protein